MLDDYEFSRFLMLAVDAWRYGPRDDRQQVDLQHSLDEGLRTAARRSGLDDSTWRLQDAGDGRLALLPDSGSEPALVDPFVRELDTWLAGHNHDRVPGARLRLRVAVHNGPAIPAPMGYGGNAVVHVCRLRDSRPVRAVLDAAPDANLVLALSALVFEDVIRQRHTSLSVAEFTKVEIEDAGKDFAATAWVRVPGVTLVRDAAVVVGLRFVLPPADVDEFAELVLRPAFTAAGLELSGDDSFEGDVPIVRLLGADPQTVLGVWIYHLDRLMREHTGDIRLVVGVCGTHHARALASSEAAADILAGTRGGRVAVVVSDGMHEAIRVSPGRLVHAETYGRVGTSSWLRVPGHAKPPKLRDDRRNRLPSAPRPDSGSVTATGDNSLAIGRGTFDTFVMGSIHHHGETSR